MVDGLFRLWATGCAHLGTDLERGGRESLAEAIRQSELGGEMGTAFEWDIGLHLGDIVGSQLPPTDQEGQEVLRQFSVAQKHRREQFYCLLGNHDASGPDEPCQWWFRKWVDPTGENTAYSCVDNSRRPFPVEGTWERYSFSVGNVLFLMMGDRNDGGPPIGRAERGGYPAGAVSRETFEWWVEKVESNQDKIIVTAHHHMLKETTVASGPWEGLKRGDDGQWESHYHGFFSKGAPEAASYLYFVGGVADAQAFEGYLAEHPGAIDLWLGGHTHTNPDDHTGGRSHIETKWGVGFVNVAALSAYHGSQNIPMSRLLTFRPGQREVGIQCYLHTNAYAPQGWYASAERTLSLSKPFHM